MRRWLEATVMALVMTGATTVAAQPEPPKETVIFKKRTVINLDGTAIEGGTERPQVSEFTTRRASRFPVKLPVRLNFRYEILTSGGAL